MERDAQQTFRGTDLARACLAIVDQAPTRLDAPWGGWHDQGARLRDWRVAIANAHNADELAELVDALRVARREVLSNARHVAPAARHHEALREELLPMDAILAEAGVARDAAMAGARETALKRLPLSWLQLGPSHLVFEDVPEASPIGAGLAWADQRIQITSSTHATVGLIAAWHTLRAERRWLATLHATHAHVAVETLSAGELRALYATLVAGLRQVFATKLRSRETAALGLSTRHHRALVSLLATDRLTALPDDARTLQGQRGFGRAGLVRLTEALWHLLERWRAPATDALDDDAARLDDELGSGFDELSQLFDAD